MSTIAITEARAVLPQLLDRVDGGDEITITRHGRPVAVLVRPDVLRARRASESLEAAGHLRELLVAAAREPLPAAGTLATERAEELIAEIDANRSTR